MSIVFVCCFCFREFLQKGLESLDNMRTTVGYGLAGLPGTIDLTYIQTK